VKGGVYILSWVKPNLGDNAFNTIEQCNKAYKVTPRQFEPDKCLHLGNESVFIYDKENDPDSDNTSTSTNELKKTDLERY
jgi:hypothetical protein